MPSASHCTVSYHFDQPLWCRPGASEEALDDAERQLGIRLCPALRVLYRVHDGQELEFDRQVGAGWLLDRPDWGEDM